MQTFFKVQNNVCNNIFSSLMPFLTLQLLLLGKIHEQVRQVRDELRYNKGGILEKKIRFGYFCV